MNAAQRPQRDAPVLPRVDAPTLNVIIDAHLALAPLGLLRTMRLARTTRVWLPRSLWSLLDNDALYRRHPERLSRRPHRALARMADQMPMWRQAWHYGRLAADVHWIGDARYEGSAPERGDPGLFQRFEACRAGLDCAGGPVGDDPLGDCQILVQAARLGGVLTVANAHVYEGWLAARERPLIYDSSKRTFDGASDVH